MLTGGVRVTDGRNMNSMCDSYFTDDSLQELSDISDFFLSSAADHIKEEPADVIQQVGHVTPVTSRALAASLYSKARRVAYSIVFCSVRG